jgi:hypothetical protein
VVVDDEREELETVLGRCSMEGIDPGTGFLLLSGRVEDWETGVSLGKLILSVINFADDIMWWASVLYSSFCIFLFSLIII